MNEKVTYFMPDLLEWYRRNQSALQIHLQDPDININLCKNFGKKLGTNKTGKKRRKQTLSIIFLRDIKN